MMCSPFFGSTKPRHGKRSDARLVLITIGALLATAALAEQAALNACTADEVNTAFTEAATCVDGRAQRAVQEWGAIPDSPGIRSSNMYQHRKERFCNYYAETSACFQKCACMAMDSCDGKTKGVAPLASQAQKEIFANGVCNPYNDADGVSHCSGELQCGSAAGLRSGAVTTLLVAALAILAGH